MRRTVAWGTGFATFDRFEAELGWRTGVLKDGAHSYPEDSGRRRLIFL